MPAPSHIAEPTPIPSYVAQPLDHLKPKAAREGELFEWEFEGEKFTLPSGAKLPFGVLADAMEKSDEVAQIAFVLKHVATPEAMETIRRMPIDEVGEMFVAWQKHGGATLGES